MPTDPQYSSGVEERPEIDRYLQSNVKGLHIIGAANGSPLLKTCINEGVEVIRSMYRVMPPSKETPGSDDDQVDLIIVGAGPAGLTAALEARKRGYTVRILEQSRPLNTVFNYPSGKHVYAEPSGMATLGQLGLEDSTKEELLEQWGEQVKELDIQIGANVRQIKKLKESFEVETDDVKRFRCRRVILAIGRMGNPRMLKVPGENLPCVYSALLNPGKHKDKDILVVGGGNSAVEAALALLEKNRVTLVYRKDDFSRASRTNQDLLEAAENEGKLKILRSANVKEFRPGEATVDQRGEILAVKRDVAFLLIGTDPPTSFLKRLGVTFEGQWTLSRVPHLAWVFGLVYTIYGIKFGRWPFHGVYSALMSARVDPGFLYGILYSILITFFGIKAMDKYRHDPYQRKRYGFLIGAQWLGPASSKWVFQARDSQ